MNKEKRAMTPEERNDIHMHLEWINDAIENSTHSCATRGSNALLIKQCMEWYKEIWEITNECFDGTWLSIEDRRVVVRGVETIK